MIGRLCDVCRVFISYKNQPILWDVCCCTYSLHDNNVDNSLAYNETLTATQQTNAVFRLFNYPHQ